MFAALGILYLCTMQSNYMCASLPILQDTVFNTEHDDTLRTGLRASKAAEDTCEMGTIAEAVKALDAAIQTEHDIPHTVASSQKEGEQQTQPEDKELCVLTTVIEKMEIAGAPPLNDEQQTLIRMKELETKRLLEANVQFATIPASEKKVIELVSASAAGKSTGEADMFVGIFIDPGLFGEPITSPHIRINPINAQVLKAGQAYNKPTTYSKNNTGSVQ